MHERVLDRFERLWQVGDKRLGIGLVSDDHIFAIDEAVRTGRVAWARAGIDGSLRTSSLRMCD
jgi:hypothetical protein